MSEAAHDPEGFDGVKARLEEIAEAVSSDDVSLDQALDLFEEAVSLGMQVSDLLEAGVFPTEDEISRAGSASEGGAAGAALAHDAASVHGAQADDADNTDNASTITA